MQKDSPFLPREIEGEFQFLCALYSSESPLGIGMIEGTCLALLDYLADPLLRRFRAASGTQQIHDLLVGAAVQTALERADGRDDAGV